MSPRLLDAFCGAGGAAHGYHLAGFEVVGVDLHLRRDLPPWLEVVQADALEVLANRAYLSQFDAIHASPPCQTHTRAKHLRDAQGKGTSKLDLVAETRSLLEASGLPWVMENVPGAPLRHDLLLCGSMFPELHVHDCTGRRWLQRHRVFESNVALMAPGPCRHNEAGIRPLGVYASKSDDIPSGGQTCRTLEQGRRLMGMPWASWAGLVEAIPPAYTAHVGRLLLDRTTRDTP